MRQDLLLLVGAIMMIIVMDIDLKAKKIVDFTSRWSTDLFCTPFDFHKKKKV